MLDVQGLSVRYGRFDALDDVSLTVAPGALVGLIGPNGAGKTTMIDAITGFVPGARGAVRFDGRRVDRLPPYARARLGMARTFQGLELFEDLTVAENLAVAAEARPGGRVTGPAPATGAFADELDDIRDQVPSRLPHRRRSQVALARALAAGPRVLLLDEPFAGLDAADRVLMAATLRALAQGGMGILLVDHDAGLVLDLCDEVCVLDFGRVISRGAPATVRGDAGVRAAYLGPTGRSGPDRRPDPSATSPKGALLVEVEHLSGGYGDVPVLHDVSISAAAGEVVALLGANGAGKTTTLLTISGALPTSAGEVRVLGTPVNGQGPDRVARRGVGHAPQDRGVTPGLTVAESLRLGARGDRAGVAWVLDRFPALRPLLARRAGDLSGGEQQLLSVGRALAGRPRLLMVDEPSLGLAPALVAEVLGTLRALADETGMATLLVEQHAFLALGVADRAYVMASGRVVLEGPAAELAARPRDVEAAYLGGNPA